MSFYSRRPNLRLKAWNFRMLFVYTLKTDPRKEPKRISNVCTDALYFGHVVCLPFRWLLGSTKNGEERRDCCAQIVHTTRDRKLVGAANQLEHSGCRCARILCRKGFQIR